MEHRDVQALLELAAVEPGGFERLAAGDTAESAALAGHLAACPRCAAEFERLGWLAGELRATVRELPPADLRERTLALVASVGRARVATERPEGHGAAVPQPPASAAEATPSATGRGSRLMPPRAWVLATAASLVIALAGVVGWWSTSSSLEREQASVARLAEVTEATARVSSQPDAQMVELAGAPADTGSGKGEVLLSSASQEIVVLAEGLPEPAEGTEYRCWIEIDGVRTAIGKMYLYGSLATWVGWSPALDVARPGARFGVSIVDVDGGAPGEPLLTGEL